MSLLFSRRERSQAKAYRKMVKRARQRSKASGGSPHGGSLTFASPKSSRGRRLEPEHKAAIAQLFCIASFIRHGVELSGVHVAHLRYSHAPAGARNPGLQRKPDDRWTLPLSPHEHRLQHSMGERLYWAELGVDPHAIASTLYDLSPDTEAMREALRGRRAGPTLVARSVNS